MLPVKSKWTELKTQTPELLRDLVKDARNKGIVYTANKYCNRVHVPSDKLANLIRGWKMTFKWDASDFDLEKLESPRKHMGRGKKEDSQVPAKIIPLPNDGGLALNEEESIFLEKYRKGEISFEEVQREFAYRVLKKVMQNPELLKVNDWLKSEIIKIQREELSMKKEQMEMSWALLFGKFKIVKYCPHCGHDLFPDSDVNKDLKGEIIDVTDIQST